MDVNAGFGTPRAEVFDWFLKNRDTPLVSLLQSMLNAGYTKESALRYVTAFSALQKSSPKALSLFESGSLKSKAGDGADSDGISPYQTLSAQEVGIRLLSIGSTIGDVYNQPSIIYALDFLSSAECDELISYSRNKIFPSTVVHEDTGPGFKADTIRSSYGCFVDRRQTKLIADIEDRLSFVFGYPERNGENIQVLRYLPGQEYKPHYDFFDPETKGGLQCIGKSGNRVSTILIYLNDVEEGGETFFPSRGVQFRARKGAVLYFDYPKGDEQAKLLSRHAGNPVLQGEKWVLTKWVREYNWHNKSRT